MKRISNQLFSAMLGISIAIGGQQVLGQSVSPPKKPTPVQLLNARIDDHLSEKIAIEESLKLSEERQLLLNKELTDLKQLETQMSVSAESYPEVLKTLHAQRVQLTIDLAGVEARSNAITRAIDEASEQQIQNLIQPLQRLVDIRSAELERLKKLKDVTSTASLRASEIALLDAKTRLAQATSSSGGALGNLNAQLLETSLERAEKTARLAKANSLIQDVDEYRGYAMKLARKQGEIQVNQAQLHDLQQRQRQIMSMINSLRIQIDEISQSP